MFMKKITIILALVLLFSLSCSARQPSTLGNIVESINGQPVIPHTANKLYVAPFINKTVIPNYGQRMQKRVVERITIGGRLSVVPDKAGSDVTLAGEIRLFQIQPISIDSRGVTIRKRLLIIASIDLINTHTNNYIFRNAAVQAFQEYSDVEFPIVPLNIVQDEVEQNLASRIALQVETGWYTSLKTDIERGKR